MSQFQYYLEEIQNTNNKKVKNAINNKNNHNYQSNHENFDTKFGNIQTPAQRALTRKIAKNSINHDDLNKIDKIIKELDLLDNENNILNKKKNNANQEELSNIIAQQEAIDENIIELQEELINLLSKYEK